MPELQYCEDCKSCIRQDSRTDGTPHDFSKCRANPEKSPEKKMSKIRVSRTFDIEPEITYRYCSIIRESDTCENYEPKESG